MALPVVYIEIRGHETQAEVFLNDIPIDLFGADGQPVHTSRVSEYLVAGPNRVEVVVGHGTTPSRTRETQSLPPEGQGFLRMAAYYSPKELLGVGGEELARLEWGAAPGRIVSTVSLNLPYHGWAWERADVVTLDGATRRELNELVIATHRAFEERNAAFLLEQSRIRLTELSRCYDPLSADAWLASFSRGVFNRSESAEWRVVPLDLQRADFRLCAGGRLVDCVNSEWKGMVRTELSGVTFTDYRMLVGRIENVWHVLR